MVLGSGIRDQGSGKTFSGSRIQGSKRHRIPDPDLQHCKIYIKNYYHEHCALLLLPPLPGGEQSVFLLGGV